MQLRRKGRNAYVAEDVDEFIARLKQELVDVRQQLTDERRQAGRSGVDFTAPTLANDVAVAQLHDRHARLAQEVAARQALIVELDEAIGARRDYLMQLADQLMTWAGTLGPERSSGRPLRASADDLVAEGRVDDYLEATEIDRKARAFLGIEG